MADKLVIEEESEGFAIVWWLEEDCDMGAPLGDATYTDEDLAQAIAANDPGSFEHIAATIAVSRLNPEHRSLCGFIFSNRKAAQQALGVAKAAIKVAHAQAANKPWPEWAVKALEAGWKPPKGWRP